MTPVRFYHSAHLTFLNTPNPLPTGSVGPIKVGGSVKDVHPTPKQSLSCYEKGFPARVSRSGGGSGW